MTCCHFVKHYHIKIKFKSNQIKFIKQQRAESHLQFAYDLLTDYRFAVVSGNNQ